MKKARQLAGLLLCEMEVPYEALTLLPHQRESVSLILR